MTDTSKAPARPAAPGPTENQVLTIEWEHLEGQSGSGADRPLTIEWSDLASGVPAVASAGRPSEPPASRVTDVLTVGVEDLCEGPRAPTLGHTAGVLSPSTPAAPAPRHSVSPQVLAANIAEQVGKRKWFTIVLTVVAVVNAAFVAVVLGLITGSWLAALAVIGALVLWCLGSYLFYSQLILRFTGARPPRPEEMARVGPMVERLAIRAGIARPTVRIVDDTAANAFAVGLRPEKATVAFSTGLLSLMTDEEVEGVAAHEVSHIAEGDTRRAVYAAGLLGWAVVVSVAATVIAFFMARIAWAMSGWGSDDRDASDVLAGVFAAIFIFMMAVMVFIVTQIWVLISRVTGVAISRQREWLADARAAEYTQNPLGLARALEKLAHTEVALAHGHRTAQALCIAGDRPTRRVWENLFSTHPPVEERIRRLYAIAGVRPLG